MSIYGCVCIVLCGARTEMLIAQSVKAVTLRTSELDQFHHFSPLQLAVCQSAERGCM